VVKIGIFFIFSFCFLTFLKADDLQTLNHPSLQEISLDAARRVNDLLGQCRIFLQVLTNNHEKVLVKFDKFASTLQRAYLTEGKISSDQIIKLVQATKFAAECYQFHAQNDINKTPYIVHSLSVAENLMTIGRVRDSDLIIASLLQDIQPDAKASFEEIKKMFGSQVEKYLRIASDSHLEKNQELPSLGDDSLETLRQVAQIQLSDKLCNLQDLMSNPPIDWSQEKIDYYFEWVEQAIGDSSSINLHLKVAMDELITSYWTNRKIPRP
jgi:hypothetical protein